MYLMYYCAAAKLNVLKTKKTKDRKCNPSFVAHPAELESTTSWSVARRSIQLSYGCWRKEWDSNPRMAHTIAGFQDRCLKPTRPSFHIVFSYPPSDKCYFSNYLSLCQYRKPLFLNKFLFFRIDLYKPIQAFTKNTSYRFALS